MVGGVTIGLAIRTTSFSDDCCQRLVVVVDPDLCTSDMLPAMSFNGGCRTSGDILGYDDRLSSVALDSSAFFCSPAFMVIQLLPTVLKVVACFSLLWSPRRKNWGSIFVLSLVGAADGFEGCSLFQFVMVSTSKESGFYFCSVTCTVVRCCEGVVVRC
ncbi:hypothetical protein L195_g047860 [Trifolium pratense]|uniref:Uncharacterized protein n=1 Tax=Trifolium pratense TaxID=57577 RepID=A0A2K3MLR2_TRIPR|nr:hypothetical protein L195_g047860 [Trifolium pratense]